MTKNLLNIKKILAVIPARSKSKRIRNKNLRIFNKKPLIYWTIKAAQKSTLINKTLVSSDSINLLKKGKEFGADYLIKRPNSLSNDTADSWDVVRHAISKLKKKNIFFDYIVMLQPTSPLRNSEHIDQCLIKLKKNNTGIISINRTLKPIEWQVNIGNENKFNLFKSGILKFKKNKRKNNTHIINGAIYAFKTEEIYKKNFIFKDSVSTFVMNIEDSIDIDTILEFKVAEFLKKQKNFLFKL